MSSHPLYYLEIPPGLFAPLGVADLLQGARVMIEKPFGHDLASGRALNNDLYRVLDESQILRVDQFLGNQPVMDISYLRFANMLIEPVWNREHVAAAHITLAENFGVDDRGAFYDSVGAMHDVVQNHLIQVMTLIAMEAPAAPGHAVLWDKKVEVFRAMADVDSTAYVRGHYDGYLGVAGVKKESATETYVALRLAIENWRWAGVPFFVRSGKELAEGATEARVVFKRPP